MGFKFLLKIVCVTLCVSLSVSSAEKNEHVPDAQAGQDQFATLNQIVILNASNSTDKDGNRLSYRWKIIDQPKNSRAFILNPNHITPSIKVDVAGTYQIELLVSDGPESFSSDIMFIDTQDTKPQLSKFNDQKILVGETTTIDGSQVIDPDGDKLSYHWQLKQKPSESKAVIEAADSSTPTITTDATGKYSIKLKVSDDKSSVDSGLIDIFAVDFFERSNRALGCVLDRIFYDGFDGLFHNSAPVANVGQDQLGVIGQSIILDGSLSSDIDLDVLTYSWSLLSAPNGSIAVIDNSNQEIAGLTPDLEGEYVAQLIVNDGCLDSDPDSALITISVNQSPQITSSPITTVRESQFYSYQVVATDPENHELTYGLTQAPTGLEVDATGLITWNALSADTYPITVVVSDQYGGSTSQSYDLTVTANYAPQIQSFPLSSAEQGEHYEYQLVVTDADSDSISYELINPVAGMSIDSDGLMTWTPNSSGSFQIEVVVNDGFGGTDSQTFTLEVVQLPPNPIDIAPPLSRIDFPPFVETISFLYEANSPVQVGLVPGTIQEYRASVLSGKVLNEEGEPLAGVKVSINNKPEYGHTFSRQDGQFDIVVNGGGIDVVHFSKGGYLDAQRDIKSEWNNYFFSEEVALVRLDNKVTKLDLTNSSLGYQIAQGNVVSDTDGERQATLMFPPNTVATLNLPDGSTQTLSNISVRATEYTVGSNGLKRMPGKLPSFSGYTYAAELSLDEAILQGAQSVDFNQTIPLYIENFLDFPAGVSVPVGWYDKQKSIWIPSDNGRVVKIIRIENAMAVLDVTNDGVENDATQAQLNQLGITQEELTMLATLYGSGESLWRSPISHFTPWDCNFPYIPPDDIQEPPEQPEPPEPPAEEEEADPTDESPETDDTDEDCEGCIINVHNRTLEERLPIIGTDYSLHYRSRPRYSKAEVIDTHTFSVSGDHVPPSLKRIEVTIGNWKRGYETLTFPPLPNQTHTIEWDGKDKYGRSAHRVDVSINVKYVYPAIYTTSSEEFSRVFGLLEQRGLTNPLYRNRQLLEISTQRYHGVNLFRTLVNRPVNNKQSKAEAEGLQNIAEEQLKMGGWTVEGHHVYNPQEQILYQGDGFLRKVNSVQSRVQNPLLNGNGGPAINSAVKKPNEIETLPNGDIVLADPGLGQLRRITDDGTILRLAGKRHASSNPYCPQDPVEGENALDMCLADINAMAVAPNGDIYIAYQYRIRKIDYLTGTVNTIAGSGSWGHSPDGTPALSAEFIQILDIKFDKNNTLYFLEDDGKLRIIDENGNLKTIAGGGFIDPFNQVFSSVKATETEFSHPESFAIAPGGNIFIADTGHGCLRQVTPDGFVYTVAGSTACYAETDKKAVGVISNAPKSIYFDSQGSLIYILDEFSTGNVVFKKILPFGMVQIMSNNPTGFSGDEGDFSSAQFNQPVDMVLNAEGHYIIADTNNNRIRKVRSDGIIQSMAGDKQVQFKAQNSKLTYSLKEQSKTQSITSNVIASRDGSVLHLFSDAGVHLKTIDALTAKVLREYSYDSDGILTSITDSNGLTTIINRDTNGVAQSIQSPYGKTTKLEYHSNGALKHVIDPLLNRWTMEYTNGFLTAFTDRANNRYEYNYDPFGLLKSDLNPIGGGWSLTNITIPSAREVTMTSAEGRTYRFKKNKSSPYWRRKIYETTLPDGTSTIRDYSSSKDKTTFPDGTEHTTHTNGSNRLGNQVKLSYFNSVKVPSGLNLSAEHSLTEVVSSPEVIAPVLSSTKTTSIDGKNWVAEFSQGLGTHGGYQNTSPESRTSLILLNRDKKINSVTVTGFAESKVEYDTNGRMSKITTGAAADQRETLFSYYSTGPMNGELQSITNAIGQTTNFEYDKNGRVTKQTLPDLREINYSYDANGNLKSLTPPGRPTHSFNYNGVDQETEYTPPAIAAINTPETTYNYNLDRQITKITRPDGQEINFNYHATTGKLETRTIPTGTYSYGYDTATGKLNQTTSPDGITLNYTYDGFLPTSTTWSGNFSGTVSRTYDSLFRVSSRTVNGSHAINYSYDDDNLLTAAGAMSISRETQKGGIINGTTLNNLTTARSYSEFAELNSYTAQYSGNNIYHVSYTRDKIGRITEKTETTNGNSTVYEYSYDPSGRLIEEKINATVNKSWQYDSNGNRTHENGIMIANYDEQDRLINYSGTVYNYNDNGELTRKITGSDTTDYVYDVLGNLQSVTLPNGTLIEYLIDPRGRRVAKKVNGVLVKGWLYKDKLNPIAELDGSGNIVSRFIYADKANVPSYMISGGSSYRIISNHLGSPIKVVNSATGAIVQEISYDAWGNILTDSNPGFQPFGFAGGHYDQATGLTRFGYRDYDAEIGRWTSKDPIKFNAGDTNLFGYVLNDPINYFDSSGLTREQVSCLTKLAQKDNPDLPIPDEEEVVYKDLNLGRENQKDFITGQHDPKTDTTTYDKSYKEENPKLNKHDMRDWYRTIIHEAIHRKLPKEGEPDPHEPGDKVYRETRRRAYRLELEELSTCL